MCGALDCPSCGPAQGFNVAREGRAAYLSERITDADYRAAFSDMCDEDPDMLDQLLNAVADRLGFNDTPDDGPDLFHGEP